MKYLTPATWQALFWALEIKHLKQVKFGRSRKNLPWVSCPGKALTVNALAPL